MDVAGSVALVTGGNRGFGASLCAALLERGAAKVYAGSRDVSAVRITGVEAVQLDITSEADIEAAVRTCGDVTLLINNAGIGTGTSVLADDAMAMAQREFDTNVLGPLAMSRAFAPVLGANGGGAIVNVLSVLSWFGAPPSALYCAAKAASWSLTNSLRLELLGQHTQVVAVHVGFMDTDMTAGLERAQVVARRRRPPGARRRPGRRLRGARRRCQSPRAGGVVGRAHAAVPGAGVVIRSDGSSMTTTVESNDPWDGAVTIDADTATRWILEQIDPARSHPRAARRPPTVSCWPSDAVAVDPSPAFDTSAMDGYAVHRHPAPSIGVAGRRACARRAAVPW